ncbi:MAG TPA: thiamine pyrophosphate-binding protein, partial [Thermoanaerobaculia bacterium]|nr:thiamine pyrophosphate-binding protein [Thermoanaerobaculia bacterium]
AAVNVTTGPGGLNALNGVFGAFTDSLGMIVVSGQVKRETTIASTGLPLRQLGDQEVDIVPVVTPITKYAVSVTDPGTIRYHVEKALFLALDGRPGPVWIDVPIDVQAAPVDPDALAGFEPDREGLRRPARDLSEPLRTVLERLAAARRPVILPGSGVRISGSYVEFLSAVERLGVPVATAFNAHDLLPNDHPLYVGRPGTVGDRPGNFAVQNADFLLVLGCRLNVRQIGYSWHSFAREAWKAMVDVDPAELAKPTLRIELPIEADLREFLRALIAASPPGPTTAHREWLAWCRERIARYPVVLPEYRLTPSPVNPYLFVEALSDRLEEGEIVVTGDGTACVCTFQAARLKQGQRLYSNSGAASMGYDLPAAVGASIGAGRRRVVCLAGDGSLQMNVQELQTVATQRLPVKLFVLNNRGYHSIRQTQQAYFPDNPVGCGPESGLGLPDLSKLAAAFGLPFLRVDDHAGLSGTIDRALRLDGPVLCEVVLDVRQPFAPKVSSRRLPDGRMVSSPLEDLAPFLPRRELLENLLVPIWEEVS